jgi:hypothetical protein
MPVVRETEASLLTHLGKTSTASVHRILRHEVHERNNYKAKEAEDDKKEQG